MTTTLSTTTYKAVKQVYYPVSKFPKELRSFPILSHVKLSQKDGRMVVTSITWNEKTEKFDSASETIPARVEQEFETCIPARQFRDWLHATLPTKEEKARKVSEQITFNFDARTQTVTIKAGNTKAQFKCIDACEFPAV